MEQEWERMEMYLQYDNEKDSSSTEKGKNNLQNINSWYITQAHV